MTSRTILLLALATFCVFVLAALFIGPRPVLKTNSSKKESKGDAIVTSPSGLKDRQSAISRSESPKAHYSHFPAEPHQPNSGFQNAPVFASTFFGDEASEDSSFLQLQDEISEAEYSFSEDGLTRLVPLLSHDSARVRAAAVDAILQMDLPSATKLLRDAASKAESSAERRWLQEAADFNELPSASLEQLHKTIGRKHASPPEN